MHTRLFHFLRRDPTQSYISDNKIERAPIDDFSQDKAGTALLVKACDGRVERPQFSRCFGDGVATEDGLRFDIIYNDLTSLKLTRRLQRQAVRKAQGYGSQGHSPSARQSAF